MSSTPIPVRRGFTLVELMIVIVILGLLATILVVAAGSISDSARSTTDAARLRSIALASHSFAADHNSRLLHPRTEINQSDGSDPDNPISTEDQIKRFWVAGYDDNVVEVGNSRVELESALTEGAAWPYLGDVSLYRSPFEPTDRIRSYSLNAFVGVDRCADDYPGMDVLSGGYNTRYRVPCPTLAGVPKTSMTICAIGEVDKGFGGYEQTANGNGWLVAPNPNMPLWKDTPALWNNNKINVSYLDGSTESLKMFQVDALRAKINQSGSTHNINIGNSAQDKADFGVFQQRMLPGILEFRTAADQE